MKTFTATILETGLESAIGGLPGWSHAGDVSKRATSFYPFEAWQVRIYFKARNRSEAARQIERLGFASPRDLVTWSPESPERIVQRKRELARKLCMEQTQRGDFSRFQFFKRSG